MSEDGSLLRECCEQLAGFGAWFMALLLLAAAVHKAAHPARSRNVLQEFARVPAAAAAAALGAAVAAEIAAAILLMVPAWRAPGALLAACVWTLYLALIGRAIVQERREVECGCSLGPSSRPLGTFHLVRNAVLTAMACGVAAISIHGGVASLQGSQVLAGCALLALYWAWDQVAGLADLRRGTVS